MVLVATLAGSGHDAHNDGRCAIASFRQPRAVVACPDGGLVVAEKSCIRQVAEDGTVSTLAGRPGISDYADGIGEEARFSTPCGLGLTACGDIVVADTHNDCIRKVSPSGAVTTLAGRPTEWGYADGLGQAARFDRPTGVAVDGQGNIYVADCNNHCIRKVDTSGLVSTLAGCGRPMWADGRGAHAGFDCPWHVALGRCGSVLFVADRQNHCIRRVTMTGEVTTFAGSGETDNVTDGDWRIATFNEPRGLAVDEEGNILVADEKNHCVRKVTPDGIVSTLAGAGYAAFADGEAQDATFNHPSSLALDRLGNVIVADRENNRLRIVYTAARGPPLTRCSREGELADALAGLLSDPRFADVTFLVAGERVAGHRNILAARSTYFATMFASAFKEGGQDVRAPVEVPVEDASLDAFKVLLEYLYTDRISLHDNQTVVGVARLAHRYSLHAVYDHLARNLSFDTAVPLLLQAAEDPCLERLRSLAMVFVAANFRAMRAQPGDILEDLFNHPALRRELLMMI